MTNTAESAPTHQCPRKGCKRRVPQNRLMCGACWFSLPKTIRDLVWRTWNGGKGARSEAHIEAMAKAVEHLPPLGGDKPAVYH